MKPPEPSRQQRRFEEALALQLEGRLDAALAAYDVVLRRDPRHAPSLHYSALIFHQTQRPGEAIARIERSLAADDAVSDAWTNAGLIYGAVGRRADAIRVLRRAVEIEPTLAEAWLNLSSELLANDDPVGAELAARRGLTLSRASTAWFYLALALVAQGRADEALQELATLEAKRPDDTDNPAIPGLRAQLLIASGRMVDARVTLDVALARVDDPSLRLERARLAETQGDLQASTADYDALLRAGFGSDATHEMALSELIFQRKRLALWDGLDRLQAAFRWRVDWHAKAGNESLLTPFSFLSDPSTRAEQRAAAEACSRRYRPGLLPPRFLSAGRLKIGYLSADLHDHATGVLTAGLFEQHDRRQFEVFAYSTGPDDRSALRRRLEAGFDQFVDARGWPALRIAQRIVSDEIDILVDLKGHTERAETDVMAMRPAPIAVSYLGYPGTMGASFIDYVIGDRMVTPLAHAGDYTETIVQLPASYQVNDDRREIAAAPTRASLGLPDDAVVLCCFNSIYKINPDVLDAWVEILKQAPNAVLWLQTRGDDLLVRAQLGSALVARGIDASRIVFAHGRPHADYLALYRCADLFLDTWPYSAHTTASDALWAGCPIITYAGETFASRVAASLLTAVGVTSGITADRANYVATAAAWARDPARLRAMRADLEGRVATSPLFDTRGTTRAIESAYRTMAQQFNEGQRAPILVGADVVQTN